MILLMVNWETTSELIYQDVVVDFAYAVHQGVDEV